MSSLRSVLEAELGVDTTSWTPADLTADIAELSHVIQLAEVVRARRVRDLTERDGHHTMGYSSPTNLVSHVARMTPGRARQVVSFANAGRRAPVAYLAWVDGRLSTDQVRPLLAAAEAVPDLYPEAEERLVEIVEGLDAVDTGKAVEYWRQAMHGPDDTGRHPFRRGLSGSWLLDGMLKVDGCLTPLAGEAFLAGLDANMPPPQDGDTRTPRQRRHDALENLCRDWLDNGTTPTTGGEKPHVSVHTDLDALRGVAGGLHETETGTIIDVDLLRMVACDCTLTRIVFGPDSEILDVGRKTRVWSPAQRKAIIARDGHCQGPGCRAKPRHCDIHHIQHWADGGDTSIENGRLLCRSCHTQQHHDDGMRRRQRRKRAQGW